MGLLIFLHLWQEMWHLQAGNTGNAGTRSEDAGKNEIVYNLPSSLPMKTAAYACVESRRTTLEQVSVVHQQRGTSGVVLDKRGRAQGRAQSLLGRF